MKKIFALILSVLMIISIFSACKAEEELESELIEEELESREVDARELGDVTIRLGHTLKTQEAEDIVLDIARKYMNDFPNITVEIESMLMGNRMALTGKSMDYDIFELNNFNIKEFVDADMLLPLDIYLRAWDGNDTLSRASKWVMKSYNDESLFIPYGIYQDALYYRKDIFDAIDWIKLPSSWEEMLDVLKSLSEEADKGIIMGLDENLYKYADSVILGYIGVGSAADSHNSYFVYDEEGELTGETIFAQEKAREGLEIFKRVFKEVSDKDSVNYTREEALDRFIDGECLLTIQSVSALDRLREEMEEGTWNAATFPQGAKKQSVQDAGFAGYAINKNSKNADAAAHFLMYLSNTDNNTHFAKNYTCIPAHSDAIEFEPYFVDSEMANFSKMIRRGDVFAYASAPYIYESFEGYPEFANEEYKKYLLDDYTSHEIVGIMDKYWREAFEKEGILWPIEEDE